MKNTLELPRTDINISESLSFSHVFQPIFLLENKTIYGFESLIRGNKNQNPLMLFAMAEQQKKRYDLDLLSVIKSIASFNQWFPAKNSDIHLTVNIFPSTVLDRSFPWFIEDLMNKVKIPPCRIIFELNETEMIQDMCKLQEKVRFLKEAGFMIALDDLGKGQSCLMAALELEPDMIKLDQYFSVDLENSIKKQTFLNWINSYFNEIGTSVTLEGIETEEQLIIAQQIGVQFGQGYHLGRPQPLVYQSYE